MSDQTTIHVDQRVRAVRVGAISAGLIAVIVALSSALPGGFLLAGPATGPVAVILGVVCLIAASLPWRRLFPGVAGEAAMGLLLLVVTLSLAAGVAFTSANSDTFWLYPLTVTFSAMVYRRRGQLLFLGLAVGLYSGASLAAGGVLFGELVFRIGVLVVASYMAGHLTGISQKTIQDHVVHNSELARASELRRQLAKSTLAMTDTDRATVLRAISEGAIAMGFEAVSISTRQDDHLEMIAAVGVLERYVGGRFPVSSGISGLVLEHGGTVTVDDYHEEPSAHPVFKELGVRSIVAVPLGDMDSGLLVAVRMEVEPATRAEIESLEVLAAQAKAALAVAGAYSEKSHAISELRRLEVMKADFLSSVSHELRTPLTVIMGLSTTMAQRWDMFDDVVRRDFVDRIESQSNGLIGVVTSLLDFARLERGTMETHPIRLDLGELATRVAMRNGPLLERHKLTYDVDEDARVHADKDLLERVVENLLTNAARHTPPGTNVDLRVAARPSSIEISVTDDGPGMPADEAARLGDRFFRGKRARRDATRGMGLGMALVRDILELHDTHLEVESAPGRGASFRFVLPRLATEATTVVGPALARGAERGTTSPAATS